MSGTDEDLAFDPTGTIMFLLENDDQVTGDQVFEYSLACLRASNSSLIGSK